MTDSTNAATGAEPPIDLGGSWRLFDEVGPTAPGYESPHVVVPVPGEVHAQLHAAGRLSDPWIDQNYLEHIPLEANHWWLARRFFKPDWGDESCWLVFEGIDCRSEVWLNGQHLGSFDGMLGGPEFEISDLLAEENELLVHILPAETHPGKALEAWRVGWAYEEDFAPLHRYLKPPAMMGGNGFPPRLITAGIWLPARLERRSALDLSDGWLQTERVSVDGSEASGQVFFTGWTNGEKSVRWRLIDPDGICVKEQTETLTFREGQASVAWKLEQPRLWWPNGHGESALYELEATVIGGAAMTRRQGIRLVCWMPTPGTDKCLSLEVNGKLIYAGGASWSSGDRLLNFDPERYRWVLSLLAGTHMTFLRLWGGLPCEPRCFYEICDELGLLVTQDFPMTNYVNDPAVHQRIDPAIYDFQVRYLLRKLRGHACVIGWMGGNELRVDEMAGSTLSPLLDLAERAVQELDPDPYRCWWRSSYVLESGMTDEYDHFGRCHSQQSILTELLDSEPRFAVEYFPGPHHAMVVPNLRSLARFAPGALNQWPPPDWTHLRRINGGEKDQTYLAGTLPVEVDPHTAAPYRSWEELAYYTQVHALAHIEAMLGNWRGRGPAHAGSNLWHAHDQQPMLSWGLVDYYGAPKGLFYGCKRGLAPVRAVMKYTRPFRDVRERLRGWVRVINRSADELRDYRVDLRFYNESLREILHVGPEGASPVAPARFEVDGGGDAAVLPADRDLLPRVRTSRAPIPAGEVFEVFDPNGLGYLFPLYQLLGLSDASLGEQLPPETTQQPFGVLVTLTSKNSEILSETYYPFNQAWHDHQQRRETVLDGVSARFIGWDSPQSGRIEIVNASDQLVPWLNVSSPDIDPSEMGLSDNFFVLPPRSARGVTLTLRRPRTAKLKPCWETEGLTFSPDADS